MTAIGPYNLGTLLPALKCEPNLAGTLIPGKTLLSEIMIRFPSWFPSLKPYLIRQGQKLTLFLIPTRNPKDIIVPGQLTPNTLVQSPLIILMALSGNNLVVNTQGGIPRVNNYQLSGSICASDGILYF